MSALAVIEHLNVFEEALARLGPGPVILVVHQFVFCDLEKVTDLFTGPVSRLQ